MIIACVISMIWLIMICVPTGWHTKSTLIWNFNVGLYYVKVDRAIVGSIAHGVAGMLDFTASAIRKKKTSVLSDALSHITTGEESLRYYRDMFCNVAMVGQMNCAPWEHLLIGSWIMLLTTIITILLLIIGATFTYYYEYHNARRKVRQWALGFYVCAGFFNMLGLGAYTGLTFSFGHWLREFMITSARTTFSCVCARHHDPSIHLGPSSHCLYMYKDF